MVQGRVVINWKRLATRIIPLGTGASSPLVPITGGYARFLPLVVVLGALASILEGLGIGLLIPLIALLTMDSPPAGLPGPLAGLVEATAAMPLDARLALFAGALLLLIVLKGIVQTANSILIGWLTGAIGRDIRTALSENIVRAPYEFFLRTEPNHLVHVIGTESWHVSDAVREGLQILSALLAVIILGAFLAWLDWRLFLLVAAGTIAIRGGLLIAERRLRRLSRDVANSNRNLGEAMLRIVLSMRAIRIFDQQQREEARFAALAERVRLAMAKSHRNLAWIAPSVDVLSSLLFLLILFAGLRLGVSIAEVTAFLVLLFRLQPHARTLSEGRLRIAAHRAAFEEVEWLLGQPVDRERDRGLPPPGPEHEIRFREVTFEYPGGTRAVHDASFVITPGSATALIGRSGSGKTTIVNLLCRLVEPRSGTITVGQTPLRDLSPRLWRDRLAIAGQDIHLVEGSVAENIAYGCPDASRGEIEDAARVAGAADFIAGLPDGYETRVGHRGERLSGGQRQRIGLARALLRRPDLLILDEATSAVDALSEAEMMRLLREHRRFHTALVISHRRSTLAACDRGIVIDAGRIVESGPLESLAYFRAMTGEHSASSNA